MAIDPRICDGNSINPHRLLDADSVLEPHPQLLEPNEMVSGPYLAVGRARVPHPQLLHAKAVVSHRNLDIDGILGAVGPGSSGTDRLSEVSPPSREVVV